MLLPHLHLHKPVEGPPWGVPLRVPGPREAFYQARARGGDAPQPAKHTRGRPDRNGLLSVPRRHSRLKPTVYIYIYIQIDL